MDKNDVRKRAARTPAETEQARPALEGIMSDYETYRAYFFPPRAGTPTPQRAFTQTARGRGARRTWTARCVN